MPQAQISGDGTFQKLLSRLKKKKFPQISQIFV